MIILHRVTLGLHDTLILFIIFFTEFSWPPGKPWGDCIDFKRCIECIDGFIPRVRRALGNPGVMVLIACSVLSAFIVSFTEFSGPPGKP